MTAAERFRAEPADQWVLRPLDDISLIFHRRSGQTHMVVSPVPEILAAAARLARDFTVADIGDALSADYDLGDPGEALGGIAAHLESLALLGLVRRA